MNDAQQISSDGVIISVMESKGTNLRVKTCIDKYRNK